MSHLHVTSVFSFFPEPIDSHLVDLWICGLSVSLASLRRLHEMGVSGDDANLKSLIELDTEDHFRLFEELRPNLEDPINTRLFCEIAPGSLLLLFGRFYCFDDVVMRELMGRKLTARARKDLDEVSEATGILRPSCARQFDNLKRIFDAGDESGFQVCAPHTTMAAQLAFEFKIPLSLAARYANILWLLHHRFNVHTSKRRTAFLDMASLEYCAEALRSVWCTVTPSEEFYPFEIDSTTVLSFRDLKNKLGNLISEIWSSITADKGRLELDSARMGRLESRFRHWLRALLSIAGGLAQGRLRDLFEDLVGAIEPLQEVPLGVEEIHLLYSAVSEAVAEVCADALPAWTAFARGLEPCSMRCINLGTPLDAAAEMSFRRKESEDLTVVG